MQKITKPHNTELYKLLLESGQAEIAKAIALHKEEEITGGKLPQDTLVSFKKSGEVSFEYDKEYKSISEADLKEQAAEIKRVKSYLISCLEAGTDCTITIDKSKIPQVLEAVSKADGVSVIHHDKHYYKCPCGQDLSVTDEDIYIYDMELPNYCPDCGQKLLFTK